jgi:hypothetical protein
VLDEDKKQKKRRAVFQVLRGSGPNICLLASINGKFQAVQKADANTSCFDSG